VIEPREVSPGRHITVAGEFFNSRCDDIGPEPNLGDPIRGIELRFEQDGRSTLLEVVNANPDYQFTTMVQAPEDAAAGGAIVRAVVPDQGGYAYPPDATEPVTVREGGAVAGRVAGPNRIETAVAISRRAFPDGAAVAYLARADDPVDAVSGGTLVDGPILVVPSCGDLPSVVAEEVRRLRPGMVVTLGGTAAVCDRMLEQAAAL
jgi:hypothetical protein